MAVKRERGVRSALQVVCIIALLLFLVGILWGEISRTALALRRESASMTTLRQRVQAVAYVFRDEVPVSSVDGGPIDYAVTDGSAVLAGDPIARVYADGSNTGTRARASEITAEIERLRALEDTADIPDYYGSYADLMSSLSLGQLLGTAGARATLKNALDRVAAQGEQAAERQARIAALEAEFDALIENDRNASDPVHAPVSGVFYRESDGYEALMNGEAVETLTPGGLRALIASPQSTAQSVGKVVVGGTWFLAVPMPQDRVTRFEVEKSYEIYITRTNEYRLLTLTRVTEADASGGALLIFRAEGTPLPCDLSRSLEIEIVAGEVGGIFVPTVALREENGEKYVLVDVNGIAEKRKITPLFAENGYCLAAPNPSPEFLQQGEHIVVTSRHIYEGKALK
ncbi:MAG: hypothetical protein IKC75_00345 [Clostridia bacterium]|nr:hypothetical protein [Clostridia bacterium]